MLSNDVDCEVSHIRSVEPGQLDEGMEVLQTARRLTTWVIDTDKVPGATQRDLSGYEQLIADYV